MTEMANRVVTLLQLEQPPDPALIQELLSQAETLALAYTGRAALPPGLEGALIRLAVVMFNRLGQEGEESRREGEIQVEMTALPEDIRAMLRPFRLGKAVTLCG
jgi:hypothetical protein